MRILPAEAVVEPIAALCIQACCSLPEEAEQKLRLALEKETPGTAGRAVLEQIVENAALAREKMRPICQDTGMAVVFLDIGFDLHIEGNIYDAVNRGVAKGYTEGYLRKSVLSAYERVNTGNNTPAVTHIRFVEGDRLKITVAPKGFGSENMGKLHMLTPAMGRQGILDAIINTVIAADACTCPPGIVGVGIGGTMELACLTAKRQLLRPIGQPSEEPALAELEQEALERINATGIGPMGLGGKTTVLAVHIAQTNTHIAGLPVAVNMQCHACRHAEVTL